MFHETRLRASRSLVISVAAAFLAAQNIQAASNLPTAGNFVAGSGNISTSGNILTINQNSLKGIIDWNTFSIAQGSTVNFKNGSGATLNRVTGVTPATILGQLLATGNIYLLNPEGILIGHGATIHTGGDFLATTLNLPNSFFLNNNLQFAGNSSATVVNLGDIASTGGSVYLIGHTVQNGGSIASANGTAGLAAGSQVLITDSSSDQKVAVQAPGGDVTNSGFIHAAQVELKSNGGNIYALAGNNGGLINATGTTTQDGHVWLIATSGTTNVSGVISATNANGAGGAIETSGAHVSTNGAQITTGKGGNWLLDPDDLTIDSALAGTIETSLNGGTDVTEQTTASGTIGSGDITVASNIAWTSGADLTLSAYRNIGVNNGVTISNTGAGNLTLRADNASTGTGTISFTGTGKVDFSGSTGNVSLLYNPSSYATPTDYTSNVLTNGSWAAPADGSVSSQMTAYMLVNTPSNLENINTNLTGTYALGQDINLTSIANWTPLAPNYPYFTGILDGMGHTISNLTINDSSSAPLLGLFSAIGSNGQVRNLNMTGVTISETGNNELSGAVAGMNTGTVSNVSVSGIIHTSTTPSDIGGLVGLDNGSVQNSNSSVTIDGSLDAANTGDLGGLVGYNGSLTILNSYATGSVSAPNSAANLGGLTGGSEAPITNSYATGSVTGGANSTIGGLVGVSYHGLITGSYATGSVTGGDNSKIGGLIGSSYFALTNSYATGVVTGGTNSWVGGLIGINYDTVSNSYATGTVFGGSNAEVGGLIGFNAAAIDTTYATGAASGSGSSWVGGLVGNNAAAISNSYATGSATTGTYNSRQPAAGGLVGTNAGAISGSYATGAVTGGDDAYAGGLVGYSSAPITNSRANGAVTVGEQFDFNASAGGLVGWTDEGGTISGSYATGPVAAGSGAAAGGLVGTNNDAITTSFAAGAVTCTGCESAGGLVGFAHAPISTSYAIGAVTGTDYPCCVGGLVGDLASSLTDTYAQGAVTANGEFTGGLVGLMCGVCSITRSYASGLVTASLGSAGGLVGGANVPSPVITDSYFDNTVNSTLPGLPSGVTSGGVTGESTAILKSGVIPGGFNPGSPYLVWVAPAGVYPYFGWQGSLVSVSGMASSGPNALNGAGVSVLWQGAVVGSTATQSNGDYLVRIPQNMTTGGLLSYLTTGGTANAFADGASPVAFNAMSLASGQVVVIDGLSTTLSGLNGVLATTLGANIGSNFLYTVPNGHLTLNSGAGLDLLAYPNFTIDQPLSAPGRLFIAEFQNLTIASASPLTAGSGNDITIGVGVGGPGTFTNNAGTSALNVSGDGIWLVYSQNPANDTLNGLTPAFKQYNAALGANPAQSGDGLLYSEAPVITETLTGTTSKTYDGTTSAALTSSNFTSSGAINGDTVTITTPTGTFASSDVGTGLGVTASGLSIASATSGSIPVYGYQLESSSATGNIGTITPATLTYTASGGASQTYGSSNNSFTGTVTGFVNGQTLAAQATGSAVFTSPTTAASNVGTYAITGSGLTLNTGNYILTQADGNASALAITPATLTYTASGGASQTYGSSNNSFTGTVTGFVNGQTLATQTNGSAAFTSPTTAASNVGTYAVTGSGLTLNTGNYTLTQADGNASALTITPATLTYAATAASQTAGSSNTSFGGAVTGFVNGQTLASATTGSAAFTSATSASSSAGTYAINGSGLTANHGNYLFTQAAGNATALTITAASVPPPPPTPTPTTLTIDINNAASMNGQIPNFTATYMGSPISGLNIASLLASLTYQVTPALNGPGTYKIAATGTAPAGYTFSIVPGTFTVLDNSPVTLPTQARLFVPETPTLFPVTGSSSDANLLTPVNSLGLFQIVTANTGGAGNGFGFSFAGFDDLQRPLAQFSYFGPSNDKRNTFVAGAKP